MIYTVKPNAQTIEVFEYSPGISERGYAQLILDLNKAAAKHGFEGFSAYRDSGNLVIELTGSRPLSVFPGKFIIFTDNQIIDVGPCQIEGIVLLYTTGGGSTNA